MFTVAICIATIVSGVAHEKVRAVRTVLEAKTADPCKLAALKKGMCMSDVKAALDDLYLPELYGIGRCSLYYVRIGVVVDFDELGRLADISLIRR